LVLFAKHENVREKHDSEGLIQYFPRLRETGNRVHFLLTWLGETGKFDTIKSICENVQILSAPS